MSFDPTKFSGYKYPDRKVYYNKRDLILYSLGIGISDLRFTYELGRRWRFFFIGDVVDRGWFLDKTFEAFPTYGLVLGLKGDHIDVNSYAEMSKGTFDIPDFPKIDLNRLVHGDMTYELLSPLPVTGGTFTLKSNLAGVYDAGKGMVIENESFLVDESGKKLARMLSLLVLEDLGPKRPRPALVVAQPTREPDAVQVDTIRPDQALLYRLSGDYNPLHADPSIGKKLGMKGAFLHGLCTMGFASAAVLKQLGGNDGKRFVSVTGRFASPVYPGEQVTTKMWKVDVKDGVETVAYETSASGRVVIAGGLFS
ncbi:MaoC like domain-containing protein [Chytridium lagenaria]|nr:MaoC like domain-containing protein [Chytridium lagenaria]